MTKLKQQFWRATRLFQQLMPPPLLATLLCAGLAAYVAFVPPINGLADNGDFYRAMYTNGIYKLLGTHYNYFDFVTQKFGDEVLQRLSIGELFISALICESGYRSQ
ncbi:hypothetical protein M1853_11680 [Lactiplantibacillus plantarum]|nr:hypothetical protein [Lactiplantibacillus plantarum]WHQ47946.1 hypothetical protein M1853_11680 [Lactiplantibacillus plantarum]